MAQEDWLPLGGLRFATRVLQPKVLPNTPTAFTFVVAGAHPVPLAALRSTSCIRDQQERLRLALAYPPEQAGAAYQH